MTTQAVATPHVPDAATDHSRWQPLLALSGIAFVPLFLVGWFASGGLTPHYDAGDQDWVNWAHDNQWRGRISAFAMLLAAFIFLHFLSVVRGVLAESRVRGSAQGPRRVRGCPDRCRRNGHGPRDDGRCELRRREGRSRGE